MRSPSTRRGSRLLRLLEALEPRTLLTTDLSGTFITAPTAFLSGSRQSVSLRVDNAGDTNARGTLAVAFYAALDGVAFDPNTAVSLGRVTRSANIAPAGNLVITTNLNFSAAFDAGSYRIYAVITPGRPAEESDNTNNTATSDVFSIAQPNYDLTTTFASSTVLTPAIVTGIQTRATVRITITNPSDSTVNIPSSQRITVQVVARPVGATDSSQDVVLRTQLVSVSSLRPGSSKTIALPLTFPADLPAGTFDIIVNADTADTLAETNETNNFATFANTLLCADPFVDSTLAFNATTTLPPSVVSDGRLLPLKFDITNLGNITIPSRQTSSISLVAVSLADGSTHSLSTLTINLAGIARGKTKTFCLKPTVPTDLGIGAYTIQASLSTTASGDILTNNSAAFSQTLSVDPPYYNLAVGTPTTSFNHALSNQVANSGTIVVPFQNLSNTIIPAGKTADVTLTLKSASSSSQDIALGTFTKSIAGLAIGATRNLAMNITIPANATAGDYVVYAEVAPAALAESTTADNNGTSTAVITLAQPFFDLAIASATTTFPTPSALGSSAIGTVVLRNTGNRSISNAPHQVHIRFWGHTPGGTFSYVLGESNFSINLAPGASSVPFNIALTLNLPNDDTLSSSINIRAEIVNPEDFDDSVGANDERSAGTVLVSVQAVDLLVHSATNPFPANPLASATASGQVTLINVASGLSNGNVTVKYWASTSTTLDGSQILLGTTVAHVSLLQTQISSAIAVPLSLSGLTAGTPYRIIVQITAPASVDNNPNDNTMLLQNSLTILPP